MLLSFLSHTVTLQSCEWTVDTLGIHFKFPEKSVDSTTRFTLFQWSRENCPVPLCENEAVVSSIVELVPVGKPKDRFAFKKPVKLVLSHGAPDERGYEVVIKQFVRQTQTREDLETRDFWSPKGRCKHFCYTVIVYNKKKVSVLQIRYFNRLLISELSRSTTP